MIDFAKLSSERQNREIIIFSPLFVKYIPKIMPLWTGFSPITNIKKLPLKNKRKFFLYRRIYYFFGATVPEICGTSVGFTMSGIVVTGVIIVPVASGMANWSTTLAPGSPGRVMVFEGGGTFSTIGVGEVGVDIEVGVVQEIRVKDERRRIISNFIIRRKKKIKR